MPIVTDQPNLITRPEEVVEYFKEDFEKNADVLGINYVAAYGERLIPGYPAVVVDPSPIEKEVHGTHTYLLTLRCYIFVMHAEMLISHAARSQKDLELATRIVNFVERDKTLGDKIIFGYVESEVPGATPIGSTRGSVVVSTRLSWMGIVERRF